jgi:hypothetical protein
MLSSNVAIRGVSLHCLQRSGLAEVGEIELRPPRLTEAKFINKS